VIALILIIVPFVKFLTMDFEIYYNLGCPEQIKGVRIGLVTEKSCITPDY